MCTMFLQLIVVPFSVWMPLVQCQAGSECVEDQTQAISVVLNGARNLTGSWISEVVVRHSEEENSAEQTHKWSVQVEPRTFQCGADKTALEVSLTFIAQAFIPPDVQAVIPSGIQSAPTAFSRADYELIPSQGHYKFNATGVTWSEARDACAAEGSHLMIINSQEEVEVFTKLFAKYRTTIVGARDTEYAWLGVYSATQGASWVTVLGESLNSTGYTRWLSGHPMTNEEGKYYVQGRHNTGELYDEKITDKYAFICEHQL